MMNEEGMRRALHRSVWFWLGCFVLVFLVSAWVDSYATATKVYAGVFLEEGGVAVRTRGSPDYELRGETQVFCHRVGTLENGSVTVDYVGVSEWSKNVMVTRRPVGFARIDAVPRLMLPSFRAYRERQVEVKIAKVTLYYLEVPMWGIVGLYVVVFCAVMVWWRRRVRTSNIERPTSNDE